MESKKPESPAPEVPYAPADSFIFIHCRHCRIDTSHWRQSYKSFNGPAAFLLTCTLCEKSVRSWNGYEYRDLNNAGNRRCFIARSA